MSTTTTTREPGAPPPEVLAFAALVAAVRHGEHGDVIRLQRELRHLGWSCLPVATRHARRPDAGDGGRFELRT